VANKISVMNKLILLVFPFFFFVLSGKGNEISRQVQSNFKKNKAEKIQLFSKSSKKVSNNGKLKEHQVLTLDKNKLSKLKNQKPKTLQISFPLPNRTFEVDLIEFDILTTDFRVNTSDGKTSQFKRGVFYRGIVKNDTNSVVSISVFDDEVFGVISNSEGNFDLGKIDGDQDYIIYKSENLQSESPFVCSTPDIANTQNLVAQSTTSCRAVRVYIECDYNLYTRRANSVQQVVDFTTGLFNQVALIYANESIPIQISEIFVWTTTDPYITQTTSSAVLTSFRTTRTSFNGNIAHLISTRPNNLGGVAYLDVLCSSSFKYAFSNIYNSYGIFPGYSWSVNVFAHEMGHNMGSPHTQSCSWVGGALDNCYTTEGGCPPGPAPVNGGTIMSYCHLTANGVNFANGFGQQPGNRIRNRFTNATCLTPSPITITPSSPTICSGQSVSLTASGGVTYTWSPQSGLNTSTGQTVIASPTSSTTYTVSSTSNGCTSTSTVLVSVLPAVNFGTLQNVNDVFPVSGDPSPVVFSIPPSGANGQFSYQWYSKTGINSAPSGQSTTGWVAISGATSNTYNPPVQSQPITFAVQVDPTGTQDCANFTWASGIRQVTITTVPQYNAGILTSGDQGFCSGGGNPNIITFSQTPSGGGTSSNNFITSPEAISTPYWTLENSTSTQNIENSPFGSLTAERVTETATNGLHRIFSPIISTSGTITSSVYVKPNGRTSVGLFVGNFNSMAQVTFSLVGVGSVVSQSGNVTSRAITQEPNGWYRISITSIGDASYRFRLYLLNSSNAQTYAGSTSAGVFVFGAKLESGTLTPYSTSNYSYQWWTRTGIFDTPVDGSTTGWSLISGATSQSYDPPQVTSSTSYACRVNLGTGSQWAQGSRKITVLPVFNPGVVSSADEIMCDPVNPSNITLSQNPSGSGAYQWAWYSRNGTSNPCPTGGSTSGWTAITTNSPTGTSLTGSGIFFDPPSENLVPVNGKTFAVLITPIANGTLPACGAPSWASGCRKVSAVSCFSTSDSLCPDWFLGEPRPNPSYDLCFVDVGIPENKIGKLVVFDNQGVTIDQVSLETRFQTLQFDVTSWSPGLYYFCLFGDDVEIEAQKLIVIK